MKQDLSVHGSAGPPAHPREALDRRPQARPTIEVPVPLNRPSRRSGVQARAAAVLTVPRGRVDSLWVVRGVWEGGSRRVLDVRASVVSACGRVRR